MLRRLIIKTALTKKEVVRGYANKAAGEFWKYVPKKGFFLNFGKLSVAVITIGHFIEEEKKRVDKVEHLILLGEKSSGIDYVHKAFEEIDKCYDIMLYPPVSENEPKAEPIVTELTGTFKEHGRKVKITRIYIDDENKLSAEKMNQLMINDQYSVVCCFPAPAYNGTTSFKRFEPYLKYRQREDGTKVFIAFTRLNGNTNDDENCIQSLGNHDLINENKVMFFSKDSKQDIKNVNVLIKPISGKHFQSQVYAATTFFFLPHMYYFLKI